MVNQWLGRHFSASKGFHWLARDSGERSIHNWRSVWARDGM